MPHIHSNSGEYDFTASAIILRTDSAEPEVFLHKHLLSGKWTQPGGHVERNESPWSAVLHEILEESGYVSSQLRVLQPGARVRDLGSDAVLQPQPVCVMTYELVAHKDHFHTDLVYAFVVSSGPKAKLSDDESKETGHFSRSELIAVSPKEIPDNVRQAALFVFDECLPRWEAVSLDEYSSAI